jgi:hypothetical protein
VAYLVSAIEVAVLLMSSYDVVVDDVGKTFRFGNGAGNLEDTVK